NPSSPCRIDKKDRGRPARIKSRIPAVGRVPATQVFGESGIIKTRVPSPSARACFEHRVPAKAGTHGPASRTAEAWLPAFAGTPFFAGGGARCSPPSPIPFTTRRRGSEVRRHGVSLSHRLLVNSFLPL